MSASSEPAGRAPARGKVVMPGVVGLQLRDARVVLRSAGIEQVTVHYAPSYAGDFEVVEQEPTDGRLVDRERRALLTVSRTSLLEYLPQIIRQSVDADETAFLRGLLYIVQHISDSVTERLDRLDQFFDPRHTDPGFLPWLGSWLAITLNPDWSELQRRKMLLAATRLFPRRGTAHAIAEFVRIYTGATVTVEENVWPFQGFRVGVHSTVGADTVILPPMNLAHCFVVHLDRPASAVPDEEIIRIHQIIQSQKPAHTAYFLAFPDEQDGGAMGAFMEIGSFAIGVDEGTGVGVGVGVGIAAGPTVEEAVAREQEPEAPPSGDAPSGKPDRAASGGKRSKRKGRSPSKDGAS